MHRLPWLVFMALLPCFAFASGYPVEPLLGVNKFDLLKQYTGTASAGDGSQAHRKVTSAMGRKAITDATDVGVSFMRIAATGFAPSFHGGRSDLELWLSNPTAYWAMVDQLMNDLDAVEMRAVFTLIWNREQFPAIAGETVGELLRNPNSRSYALAARYIREFIERYRDRRTILFYELTNELNLGADLDIVTRCQQTRNTKECAAEANYTSDEMVAFTGRVAKLVHAIDPGRAISSGL